MLLYRKVFVKIWADEKFKALSDKAQLLWFYLLTGPHTTPLPGIFCAGPGEMAERLGWKPESFHKCFNEIIKLEMAKVDNDRLVVWLPNVIFYNKPQNPNVVKSWAPYFDLIPDCPLKTEYLEGLKTFLETKGEAFSKALEESFDYRIRTWDKDKGKGIRTNKPASGGIKKADPKETLFQEKFERLWAKKVDPPGHPGRHNKDKSRKAWNARMKDEHDPNEILIAWENYLKVMKQKPDMIMGLQRFIGPGLEWQAYIKLKPGAGEGKAGADKSAAADWEDKHATG